MDEVDNDDISWGDVSGEDVSGSESASVDSDPGPYDEISDNSGIKPYQFEPRADVCEGGGEKVGSETSAGKEACLHDVSLWCKCGKCSLMGSVEESVCCRSIEKMTNKCQEVETLGLGSVPSCITEHPGFASVCLDVWVLQAVYNEFRQTHGDLHKPLHERYRYCAYRHLVRWCWGFLGKHHRVPLPSCAVLAIRAKFPPTNITGFRYPD